MLGGVEDIGRSEQKVLGVCWNPLKDVFIFDLTEIASYARDLQPTKSIVVSVAAKFYDPFAFLSPIILELKLFFQELCKTKIGWDDPLNDNLLKMWRKLLNGLESAISKEFKTRLSVVVFMGLAMHPVKPMLQSSICR